MSSQVRIFLPCDVFTVRVRFGVGTEVTELEHLLLRAIRAREHSIASLRALLGLTERMMYDLLFDLWKIGYVALSYTSGEVFLAGDAALWEKDETHGLPRLASLEAEDTRQLMIDRFVGHVYPLSGESSAPNPKYVVPDNLGPLPLAEVTTEKLISALSRVQAADSVYRNAKQVLSAYIPFQDKKEKEKVAGKRWYGIDIAASTTSGSDRFVAQVMTTRNLPPGVRHAIERELGRLVSERPDNELSRTLVSRARRQSWRPRDSAESLQILRQRLKEAPRVDQADYATLHQDLRDVADDLAAEIEERRLAEAEISVVAGADEHQLALQQLIKKAQHQIIISSPFVRALGLQQLREPLLQRMGAGVIVFIMWGLANIDSEGAERSLDNETRNVITQLQGRFPNRFFWTFLPSRTHANILVQDDRRALVTSMNILAPSRSDVVELGVLVDGRPPGATSALTREALLWARRTYPEYHVARAILRSIPRDGRQEQETPPQVRVRSEFSPPEPPNVAQATDGGIARAASKLWIEQWRSFTERIGAELSRGRTAARLILDEEHARVFQDALATAHRRLLVVSDTVAPEVVTRELLNKMVERTKGGVSIRFVFNRFAKRDEGETKLRQYLDEAQASSDGRFTWVKANTRANLIVADDAAIVTSFSFLSFANTYVERAALGRRQSSELGALCTGLGAADSLIEALKRTCPAAVAGFISFEQVVAEEPVSVPESAFSDSLQQILAALTAGDAEVQFEPAFANASDPWGLLDQVAASGIHGSALRRAIAACLAVAGSSGVDNRDRWVRRLALIAWEHADPFETAVLVASLGGEVGEELPNLCALLTDIALTDGPSLGKVLEALRKWDEPTQCDSIMIVLLGVVALLGGGHADALDLLIHGAVLGDPWPNLVAEIETYWEKTYEPFPTAHFKQLSRRAEVERLLDAEWSRLSERIDEASREHFKFPKGTMIWAYLFHPAGRFGRLREMAEQRDAAGVSAWLRTEQVDDLAAMLLSAAVAVHGSESHAIAGNKRAACIDALSTVVEEARELVRLSPGVSDVDTNWLIERATALRESLTSAWPDLEVAVRAAVTVGVLPVVDRALRRIRQILAME